MYSSLHILQSFMIGSNNEYIQYCFIYQGAQSNFKLCLKLLNGCNQHISAVAVIIRLGMTTITSSLQQLQQQKKCVNISSIMIYFKKRKEIQWNLFHMHTAFCANNNKKEICFLVWHFMVFMVFMGGGGVSQLYIYFLCQKFNYLKKKSSFRSVEEIFRYSQNVFTNI